MIKYNNKNLRCRLISAFFHFFFFLVNFDHFQILRAIGKGSFGKVSPEKIICIFFLSLLLILFFYFPSFLSFFFKYIYIYIYIYICINKILRYDLLIFHEYKKLMRRNNFINSIKTFHLNDNFSTFFFPVFI